MWQKLFQRKYRPVWATLAVIVVLVVSLSFPQIRAVATSFLGLFRVEQIEAVEVGISQPAASRHLNILRERGMVEAQRDLWCAHFTAVSCFGLGFSFCF